jgi:hypothetical protein
MTFVWPTSHIGMLHPLAPDGSHVRERALEFLRLAQASVDGKSYRQSKGLFRGSQHLAETKKAFYGELGLLYVPRASNTLRLTPVGQQLLDILGTDPTPMQPDEVRRKVDTLLMWALSSCQINRPSGWGSPRQPAEVIRSCTVKPYAAFWQAIRDLDGYVTKTEFLHGLASLHVVEDYEKVIQQIRSHRSTDTPLPTATRTTANYFIYWKSHLTVADRVLTYDSTKEVFEFQPERQGLVEVILDTRMGCNGRDVRNIIGAAPWTDDDDYYRRIGGVPSPTFLAKGQVKVVSYGSQSLNWLQDYPIRKRGDGFLLEGGVELCALPLKAQCFHEGVKKHLLRIDRKDVSVPGKVRLLFGQGRRIADVSKLMTILNQ